MRNLQAERTQLQEISSFVCQKIQKWESDLSKRLKLDIESETELSQKYGYKHARLIEQATIFKIFPFPWLEVPLPHGISTHTVHAFLNKGAPEVSVAWSKLKALYEKQTAENKSPQEFLQSPEVREILTSIKSAISEAFIKAAHDLTPLNKIELEEDCVQWLQEMEQKGSPLMVRSSGAEDSGKTANAGGNESIAYVALHLKELLKAVGRVVSSYYSEGSLLNRLNSEEDLFNSQMQLSVTVQELIGEKIEEESPSSLIPVSLVLFTNEPTYVGNEDFRVMRLSATYGHGEGVVGAKGVNTDTIMILRSVKHPERLYILENNSVKPLRLAPRLDEKTGDVNLSRVENPPELVKQAALNQEMLTRLFYLGLCVEHIYGGCPIDMELVVKAGKIYPVQARPVNRQPQHPTYLDTKAYSKEGQGLEKLKLEPFLPGLAKAQVIRSSKHLLVTRNLEEAQRDFKKGQHLLVVVKEEEPANSHPVVNFSGMGIPVLYCDKMEEVQNFVKKLDGKNTLIACVQSGQMLICSENDLPENFIRSGYVTHPARMAISTNNRVLPETTGRTDVIPQELKQLLTRLRAMETEKTALEALKEIKKHPLLQQIAEARTRLSERLTSLKNFPKQGIDLNGLEGLDQKIYEAASELKVAIKAAPLKRLHTLFHVKALETLIGQEKTSHALGRLSAVNVRSQIKAVEKMMDYHAQFHFSPQFTENILDREAIYSEEQAVLWDDFISKIEMACQQQEMTEEAQNFRKMLDILRDSYIVPLWMSRFFLPKVSSHRPLSLKEAVEITKQLLSDFKPETWSFIQNLRQIRSEMVFLEEHLDKFADPAHFKEIFQKFLILFAKFACPSQVPPFLAVLKKKLEEEKINNTFTEFNEEVKQNPNGWHKLILKTTSPLERITAYQLMKDFVTLFDHAIKAMKGSQMIDSINKKDLFFQMLFYAQSLMEGWYRNMPLEKAMSQTDEVSIGTTVYFAMQNSLLPMATKRKLYEAYKKENTLDSSEYFDVSAATIGQMDFSRCPPSTLEDFFTFFHQNLLKCIQYLLAEETESKIVLSSSTESVKETVAKYHTR